MLCRGQTAASLRLFSFSLFYPLLSFLLFTFPMFTDRHIYLTIVCESRCLPLLKSTSSLKLKEGC